MPNTKKHIIVLVCMALIACQPVQVKTTLDPFDQRTVQDMTGNTLVGGGLLSSSVASLNPRKVINQNGDTRFYLVLDYSADSWLFIERGESLVLLLDERRVGFYSHDGSNSSREVGYGGHISERAIYPVTTKNLIDISHAVHVQVKIIGSKGYITREFNEAGIAAFAGFVKNHVNVSSDSDYTVHAEPLSAVGAADQQGNKILIPEDLLDFANGNAALITPGLFSGYGAAASAGVTGRLRLRLHDTEQWEALARETLKTEYGENLGWYYLGRAAEGMALCDAAEFYYGISKERSESMLTSCLGPGCYGIKLPDALEERLAAVEVTRKAGKCITP